MHRHTHSLNYGQPILSAVEQHTVLHYAYIEKQTVKIMNKEVSWFSKRKWECFKEEWREREQKRGRALSAREGSEGQRIKRMERN